MFEKPIALTGDVYWCAPPSVYRGFLWAKQHAWQKRGSHKPKGSARHGVGLLPKTERRNLEEYARKETPRVNILNLSQSPKVCNHSTMMPALRCIK